MKRVIVSALAIMAMAGCSESENIEITDFVKVKFTTDQIATRTTANDLWESGDNIGVFTYGFNTVSSNINDYTNVKYVTDMEANEAPIASTNFKVATEGGDILYPNSYNTRAVTFKAYYPYPTLNTSGDIEISIADQKTDFGAKDFMCAVAENVGYGNQNDFDGTVPLSFKHKLAKIELIIHNRESVTSLNDLTVAIESIAQDAAYNMTSDAFTIASDATKSKLDLVVDLAAEADDAADDAVNKVVAMVIPATYSYPLKFIFTLGGRTIEASAGAREYVSGKYYKYDVYIGNDYADFEGDLSDSNISDWVSGGAESEYFPDAPTPTPTPTSKD